MPQGASGSARQLERITAIDRLLREGLKPGTADLAQQLGVSQRTVFRDLVFLKDRLGAPVSYDPGSKGYLYTGPHRFFPGVSLSPPEVLSLALAVRVAGPLLGQQFSGRLQRAVWKILDAGNLRWPGVGNVPHALDRLEGESLPGGASVDLEGSGWALGGTP
jgi:predicted DNA-binding transcriptional regulator YafY